MTRIAAGIAVLLMGAGIVTAPLAAAAPYKNCTQARQNGDTNIPSSSDKYGPWLDRDGDGIGCEAN